MNNNDQILLDRWGKSQDAEAFKVLASKHAGMVYGTCRRILGDATEAEDIAQECFLHLARAKSAIGPYLSAWLYRVAVNKSLNQLRAKHRRQQHEKAFLAKQDETGKDVSWNDVFQIIDEAIARLPERERVPLIAHFFEDQTHEQIADTLSVSRQTVTYRIGKGVERIRRHLQKTGISVTALTIVSLVKANIAEAAPPSLAIRLSKIALAGTSAGPLPTGPATTFLGAISGTQLAVCAAFLLLVSATVAGIVWTQRQTPPARTATSALHEPGDATPPPSPSYKAEPTKPLQIASPETANVQASVSAAAEQVSETFIEKARTQLDFFRHAFPTWREDIEAFRASLEAHRTMCNSDRERVETDYLLSQVNTKLVRYEAAEKIIASLLASSDYQQLQPDDMAQLLATAAMLRYCELHYSGRRLDELKPPDGVDPQGKTLLGFDGANVLAAFADTEANVAEPLETFIVNCHMLFDLNNTLNYRDMAAYFENGSVHLDSECSHALKELFGSDPFIKALNDLRSQVPVEALIYDYYIADTYFEDRQNKEAFAYASMVCRNTSKATNPYYADFVYLAHQSAGKLRDSVNEPIYRSMLKDADNPRLTSYYDFHVARD